MSREIRQLVQELLERSQSERLLTIRQAADRLSVSTRTIYRLVADGQLESVKVRGCTRLRESAVAAVSGSSAAELDISPQVRHEPEPVSP